MALSHVLFGVCDEEDKLGRVSSHGLPAGVSFLHFCTKYGFGPDSPWDQKQPSRTGASTGAITVATIISHLLGQEWGSGLKQDRVIKPGSVSGVPEVVTRIRRNDSGPQNSYHLVQMPRSHLG